MSNLYNSNQKNLLIPLIALTSILSFSSVFAQQTEADVPRDVSSTYTSLDLEKCHQLTQQELGLPELTEEEMGVMGGQWLCQGYNESIVYVAEGDLRMFVSYGANAMRERARSQTLPQFNYIGDTIEWRLHTEQNAADATPVQVPFATILRWHTESGDMAQDKGEVLIVTKLEPGNTCHVAYIDARLTPNANQVARDFADNEVAGFDCKKDDILYVPS